MTCNHSTIELVKNDERYTEYYECMKCASKFTTELKVHWIQVLDDAKEKHNEVPRN